MRTIYFDIDGVMLNYDEKPMEALTAGRLQSELQRLDVDTLVCLSGWSDIVNTSAIAPIPIPKQKGQIATLLGDLFPDREWLLNRLILRYNSDARCQHIDLSTNWFYLDDWADQFFVQQFGAGRYQQELGRRILRVDPYGEGADILDWLHRVVSRIERSD